jgi:hypothetical protein
MKQNFVKLNYDILEMRGLSSTDKIVLAYRLGFRTFYNVKPKTVAAKLHLGVKTAERSITKLRKLGLWDDSSENVRSTERQSSCETTKKLGGTPKMLGAAPKILGDKKSISPMKTAALLDSSLDIKLEKNKKEGLDSAAVASPLCDKPQTVLKKLDSKTPVTSDSQEIIISGVSGSEAPSKIGIKTTGPAVPLGPTGKPMTRADMTAANFVAMMDGKPEPFTAAQVAAGSDGNPWLAQSAEDFDSVFGRRAG